MENCAPPAFVVVADIAASWADYPASGLAFADGPAIGLILHAAGPTQDGVRIVDVWTSEESYRRHRELHGDGWPPGLAIAPTVRSFRVDHLLAGSDRSSSVEK
jgi:hypothetical protein